VDAREELVAELWNTLIRPHGDVERLRRLAPAARLLDAGASEEDLVQLAQLVAYGAVFGTLFEVTQPEHEGLLGLHEDLLIGDPTGREGADFLGD